MAIRTGFHRRETEFACLRGMFDAVGTKGADGRLTDPRMVVIVAESEIGKSRLAQDLYIQFTKDPKWELPEVDYWLEAFGDGGVDLDVKPDMSKHDAEGPLRFLWLGARWRAPDVRRRSDLVEQNRSVRRS